VDQDRVAVRVAGFLDGQRAAVRGLDGSVHVSRWRG
jgi:hypothetical protein